MRSYTTSATPDLEQAARRTYVERSCDEWWILPALHGLVHPDEVLEPYEFSSLYDPKARSPQGGLDWSGRRESNSRPQLGKLDGRSNCQPNRQRSPCAEASPSFEQRPSLLQ